METIQGTCRIGQRFVAAFIRVVAGGAMVAGCGSDAAPPPTTTPGAPTTNAEHNSMLDGLGFSTDVGSRVDENGQELSATWHPLATKHASFFPANEVYIAGPTFGTTREVLRDDARAEYQALNLKSHPDPSWLDATFKAAIAADVDGDGFDEFVVVYFANGSNTLKYIVIDKNDDREPILGVVTAGADSTNLNYRAQPSLAAGDLNGDGIDEIAVGFGSLYVLEGLTETLRVTTKGYPENRAVMVAIGNTDLDTEDELVATHIQLPKGHYEIIDGVDLEAPTQSGELTITDMQNVDHNYRETRVAIGDVDGNRIGDIVFHGVRTGGDAAIWELFVLKHQPQQQDYQFRSLFHKTHTSPDLPWTVVPVDIDGDGIDEVYAWDQLVKFGENNDTEVIVPALPTASSAVAGNVDSDRREELILANTDSYLVYGYNELDVFSVKHQETATVAGFDSPALAIGNVDADSAMVRYDGQHELLFTEPNILTVLSAPPYHAGIGQDIDSCTTTYGVVESSEIVKTRSMGVNVGFSVGYEAEFSFFGVSAGASAKTTVEAAFDYHASKSQSRENWYSHTSAPGEDKVVFSAIPFDVYYYTVVSSPNPDEVGRVLSINMPRNQQVIGSTLDFYNQNNGGAVDIDESVIRHTVGDPWSYPSAEDKTQILTAAEKDNSGYIALWNGPIQVDESGSNSLGLSTSEGSAQGSAMDFSTTFEFEAKAGGFTAGGSVGFHYGYEVEVSTEEGAFYEGTVGSIPGAVYADNTYCYGLMVYPKSAGNQRFTMIDYWTQQRCGGM